MLFGKGEDEVTKRWLKVMLLGPRAPRKTGCGDSGVGVLELLLEMILELNGDKIHWDTVLLGKERNE